MGCKDGQTRVFVTAFWINFFFCYTQPALAISGSRWLKLRSDERICDVGGVLDTGYDDVALGEKNLKSRGALTLSLRTSLSFYARSIAPTRKSSPLSRNISRSILTRANAL